MVTPLAAAAASAAGRRRVAVDGRVGAGHRCGIGRVLLIAALHEGHAAVDDQAGHRDDRDEGDGKQCKDLAALRPRVLGLGHGVLLHGISTWVVDDSVVGATMLSRGVITSNGSVTVTRTNDPDGQSTDGRTASLIVVQA